MSTGICYHGVRVGGTDHCARCISHHAGLVTAQLREAPDAGQQSALDTWAAAGDPRVGDWWCGWAEGKEPSVTDPRTGHRIATHVHICRAEGTRNRVCFADAGHIGPHNFVPRTARED